MWKISGKRILLYSLRIAFIHGHSRGFFESAEAKTYLRTRALSMDS
jgi:hypothetical protein